MSFGCVMPAAGSASRMGSIKQLLPYRGKTLLEHAIEQAHEAGFSPIVVVVGAEAGKVREAVARTAADSVINENWAQGMGSSIVCGVTHLLRSTRSTESIAVLLADQPRVTAARLIEMKRAFENASEAIMAASYAGTLGVPAMFKQAVFPRLLNLKPEAGARMLLRGGGETVCGFELPEGEIDVDTPGDFLRLGVGEL